MDSQKTEVQDDFDRIAGLTPSRWEHNLHYHPFLLNELKHSLDCCMDIGCGTGDFTRTLAQRSQKVIGLDFSHKMIEKARRLSSGQTNIQYIEGDFLEFPMVVGEFDCISSIATVHHLPLSSILQFAKSALKPGGKLLILDLYEPASFGEYLMSCIAVPVNIFMSLIKTGRLRKSKEEVEAWEKHSKNDHYMRIGDIKKECEAILPGARVRYHLFWRYSLVWEKSQGL